MGGITLTLALASFTVLFFWKISETLTDEARTQTAKWLRGLPHRGTTAEWPTLFLGLFDSLFGLKFIARRFFLVSAAATLILGSLISLFYLLFQPTLGRGALQDAGTWARLLLLIPILNTLIDYVSVIESRVAMRWMTHKDSRSWRLLVLAVDFALTAGIHMTFTAAAILVVCQLRNAGVPWVQGDQLDWMCSGDDALQEFQSAYAQTLNFELSTHPSFQVSFYTTFATSIWVWLYFLSGVIVRTWSHAMRLVGRPLDAIDQVGMIDSSPVKLMGLISGLIVLAAGLTLTAIL